MDITTSVVAEGKVRVYKNAGKPVPEGWLIDNQGHPTTDPNDLYTDPRGAILPFGGAVGHKGFALGIMVDILSGALSGGGCSYSNTCRLGNAMYFHVIDIEKFVPPEEFLGQVAILERHVKASPPAPGFQAVIMPGEPEFAQEARRRREGISIDEETWRQFAECARGLGVEAIARNLGVENDGRARGPVQAAPGRRPGAAAADGGGARAPCGGRSTGSPT